MNGTKRKGGTLDAFFGARTSSGSTKKVKAESHDAVLSTPSVTTNHDIKSSPHINTTSTNADDGDDKLSLSTHASYPFPIAALPSTISTALSPPLDADPGHAIENAPTGLDLLYFAPFLPRNHADALFAFLRSSLPFYRVNYEISRGAMKTQINTPRFTTVFGVDASARFDDEGNIVSSSSSSSSSSSTANGSLALKRTYPNCRPRPLPACLDALRLAVERETGERFNFCLVNYYASGADSISFHSDDERFLGGRPAIASISLGGTRDFLMKPKSTPNPNTSSTTSASPPLSSIPLPKGASLAAGGSTTLKFPLASGDMLLMRGDTQARWLHSIPKRKGARDAESARGRINITFRRAVVPGGTENYYRYNVGAGPVHRWDATAREMRVWEG